MILDSNIVIYAVIPEYESLRKFLKKYEYELAVSSITKLEVLGYHKLSNKEKDVLEKFFDAIRQIPVSQTIINKAVELRQSQKMSMGDAIIASTALSENDTLLTNNEDDFKNIEGIKILPLKNVNKE